MNTRWKKDPIGKIKLAAVVALAGCLLLVSAALAQEGRSANDWWVVANGGGPSAGGSVALDATLGQPITGASASAGGSLTLSSGYWYGPIEGAMAWLYLPVVER